MTFSHVQSFDPPGIAKESGRCPTAAILHIGKVYGDTSTDRSWRVEWFSTREQNPGLFLEIDRYIDIFIGAVAQQARFIYELNHDYNGN